MDKVILYRSQTEAEIDRIIWSGDGSFFIIMIYCLVYVLCFCVFSCFLLKLSQKFYNIKPYAKWNSYISGIVSLPAAYGILKILDWLVMKF